jgi:hypothetical protein
MRQHQFSLIPDRRDVDTILTNLLKACERKKDDQAKIFGMCHAESFKLCGICSVIELCHSAIRVLGPDVIELVARIEATHVEKPSIAMDMLLYELCIHHQHTANGLPV